MSSIYNPSPAFRDAADYLSNAPAMKSVSDATKLELYSIFKYLTVSPSPNVPRPSIFDFTRKAKWDAWNAAGETYKERPADAEARYLEIARSLEWTEGKPAELELVRHVAGGEEEDIWDSDTDTAKPTGGDGGIGRVMSTMIMDGEGQGTTSPVSNLAISGDAEALGEYLQEHPEVNINTSDENGYTALHLAADRGHAEVVKVLLERGADREIKDEDDFTAKELAEVAGHDEVVDLLSVTRNPSS